MLQAPTNDHKTKAEASSKTAEYLPEYEQSSQLMGGMGRSRQSHSLQQQNDLATLQKVYGNQAVLRMKGRSPAANPLQGVLQRKCACGNTAGSSGSCTECQRKQEGILQTKLQIGEPGDRYEQEADRVAEQVLSSLSPNAVSIALQRIQRFTGQAAEGSDNVPTSVENVLGSSGSPLEPLLRQDMEQRFGYDFSQVHVHVGTAAEQSAVDVNAKAYTAGQNIVFGAGQFAPGTRDGRRLIAHELTHVVQQSGPVGINFDRSSRKIGLSPTNHTIQRKESGVPTTDEDSNSDDQSLAIPSAEPLLAMPAVSTDTTQFTTTPATATTTPATATITLETGNATDYKFINNAYHQQICLELGPKRCFSFAATGVQLPQFSSTWLGWSSTVAGATMKGEVYEATPVPDAEIVDTHSITGTQGFTWLKYMVGTRMDLEDSYSAARHNCRAFSQWEFSDAPTHW